MATPKRFKRETVFKEYSVSGSVSGQQCSMLPSGQVKRGVRLAFRNLEVIDGLEKSSFCGVMSRGQSRVDYKREVGKWWRQ